MKTIAEQAEEYVSGRLNEDVPALERTELHNAYLAGARAALEMAERVLLKRASDCQANGVVFREGGQFESAVIEDRMSNVFARASSVIRNLSLES